MLPIVTWYTCCSVRLLSKHSVPPSLSLSLNKAAVGVNGRLALETGLSRIAASADRLSQPSALCPELLTGGERLPARNFF